MAQGRRGVSEEENKAVIRGWIEAYNERDLEAEADVLAPGFVAHVPTASGPLDSEAWTQFLSTFGEAFPDLRLAVEDIAAEGDTVAARVAFHGTHRGEFQGIPPTDKEVAFSSLEFTKPPPCAALRIPRCSRRLAGPPGRISASPRSWRGW